MVTQRRTRVTAERFVEATLELIAENGGSQNVNLRQISRRVGCAHTNVYNYFSSYDDLLWAAFRRALRMYGEYLVHDLDDTLPPDEYLRRVITNLATYPEENQGLYRFIGSDPIDLDTAPRDVLESAGRMKQWLFDVLEATYAPDLEPSEAERISNIVLAYVDGETLNLINGRVVPGENIRGRVVENAMRVLEDLSGLDAARTTGAASNRNYPTLDLTGVEGAV